MTFTLAARTADGIDLAVDIHESRIADAPTLLLIPGLGSSRSVYASFIPYLTAFARVAVYDPRGIGESAMSDPPWTLELLGSDAAAVIAAVSPGVSADVFGASMGGVVAQHLALDHPASVRRLILAATTPGGARAIDRNTFARDRLLGRGARTPGDAYRLASTVLYSRTFQALHEDFIEAQVQQRAQHPVRARAFSAQADASFSHDAWDRLPSLRLPVLVAHGTEDVVMPLANARLLESRIPGATHHWFDGLGHLFFHEAPELSAEVVEEFLTR